MLGTAGRLGAVASTLGSTVVSLGCCATLLGPAAVVGAAASLFEWVPLAWRLPLLYGSLAGAASTLVLAWRQHRRRAPLALFLVGAGGLLYPLHEATEVRVLQLLVGAGFGLVLTAVACDAWLTFRPGRPPASSPARRGRPRETRWLLALPCLTCAGQLPVLLAVLALTGWAGPLSAAFGVLAGLLAVALAALFAWGARALGSSGEAGPAPPNLPGSAEPPAEPDRRELAGRSRRVLALAAALGVLAGVGVAPAAPERVRLKVEGLTETGCSSPPAVRATLLATEGVTGAEVSRERGEAVVELDPARVDLAELMARVERFCLVRVSRPTTPE